MTFSSIETDEEFLRMEKEFKFLSRARQKKEEEGEALSRTPFVVFDVETTGLDPNLCEIIEVGAFRVKGEAMLDHFHALIKPEKPLPAVITNITGIKEEMLASCPGVQSILPQFLSFIGRDPLVAHNIDFDFPFLNVQTQKLLGKGIQSERECTLRLSRTFLPHLPNHKLHTVANALKVPLSQRHRALGDAEITAGVWIQFVKLLAKRGIETRTNLKQFFLDHAEQHQRTPF